MQITEEMFDSPYLAFWLINTYALYQMNMFNLINALIYSTIIVVLSFILASPMNAPNDRNMPDYILDIRPNWQILRERYNLH